MKPVTVIRSRAVFLPLANIDTDQIIPARFLKGIVREGLSRGLFAGWRFDRDGNAITDFALNRPEARGARILITGENFGCGSSREHAAWALKEFGFQAIVSPSFADIFYQNAIKNSLWPVTLVREHWGRILTEEGEITLDLPAQTLTLADGMAVPFAIDAFSKHCLASGLDELGYLLSQGVAIDVFERGRDL